MELPNIKDVKPVQFLKFALVVLLGLLMLAFAFSLISSTFSGLGLSSGKSVSVAPGTGGSSGGSDGVARNAAMEEMAYDTDIAQTPGSIAPVPPEPGYVPGDDAEDYEVTEYTASIETRDKPETCGAVSELRSRDDVVFENASEHDRGCSYRFKVENASAGEVLSVIESLDPKELTERTYTIKRVVTNYANEIEILENKLASIDETLETAAAAYDEITALARRTGDAEALASVIDSKVRIIEKLTQERIEVATQLDRLSRRQGEQLDRLEYTYFTVTVTENVYLDREALADSWKAAIRNFVRDVNQALQDVTVNFAILIITVAKFALYFIVLLLVAKYGWRYTTRFWNAK